MQNGELPCRYLQGTCEPPKHDQDFDHRVHRVVKCAFRGDDAPKTSPKTRHGFSIRGR
jgi:hypothetical protein